MEETVVKGMTFVPYISEAEIQEQVNRVAREIVESLGDDKAPIFLCVLNGAFVFAADLFRACDLPEAEITFIRFKSYEGTSSTGVINQVMGLTEDIEGRNVIIIEDIVDTGVTSKALRETLAKHNPKSVKMAALLYKPKSLTTGQVPEFVGFEIPSKFILGYGLDLDGQARGLRDILVLKED
ncbi:MAG: phosphoribosyltransferase family protein [Bacteroidales bacterium]|nr:phosphoribosyltransferase family protein [Bacteroidales bacterium]